jgi:hypothetical protein
MDLYYRPVSRNLILRVRLAPEFQQETLSTKPLPSSLGGISQSAISVIYIHFILAPFSLFISLLINLEVSNTSERGGFSLTCYSQIPLKTLQSLEVMTNHTVDKR